MQASTNKGSFSLAQQKTDVSHAECGKAREWEMELQTQGKSITSTPQIQWDNSCTLYECITFKNSSSRLKMFIF